MVNQVNQIPTWIRRIQREDWQTEVIDLPDLRCSIPICRSWSREPDITTTPMEIENFFPGHLFGEGLIIKFMETADPEGNICNWVDGLTAMAGFPIASLQKTLEDASLQLLQWNTEGICLDLAEKLGVEETHLYQGLASISKPIPTLLRLYTLLARRGQFAWQVSLSLSSACLPGTPEEIVDVNDHCRAGATFGELKLG
jgi:hypothetical protein